MVGLPLVDDVEHLFGIEGPTAVQDGSQIRRAVHGRALGGHHQQGRQVALVALAADPDDPRALVVLQQAAGLEVGDHLRDQGIGVALALPEVEVHAQGAEVPGQGDLGHPGEVSPQEEASRPAGLQGGGQAAGAVAVGLVGLTQGRSLGIHPVEVGQADAL